MFDLRHTHKIQMHFDIPAIFKSLNVETIRKITKNKP